MSVSHAAICPLQQQMAHISLFLHLNPCSCSSRPQVSNQLPTLSSSTYRSLNASIEKYLAQGKAYLDPKTGTVKPGEYVMLNSTGR